MGNVRTLLPWEPVTKQTTFLVIQLPPVIKKGILLSSRVRPVSAVWSAQCSLCWQFGHPAAGCSEGHSNPQCCRTRSSMPLTPQLCQGRASPQCVNCGAGHLANSPSCPKRVGALAEQRARPDKLVRGSPPSWATLPSFPDALDLKSVWCDAAATAMLVHCTRTAYPPGFTPHLTHIAFSPGFGAACHCPPSVLAWFLFGAVSGVPRNNNVVR